MHDANTLALGAARFRPSGKRGLSPCRSAVRDRGAANPLAGAALGLAFVCAPFAAVQAAGEVSSLRIDAQPGTPFRYVADGTEYTWGTGQNRLLDGFSSDGWMFGLELSAERVELRLGTIAESGGSDGGCRLFAERGEAGAATLAPDYPGVGSAGGCNTASVLKSRVLNRGALDLFADRLPGAAGIERVDYLFDSGILAPVTPEGLARAGHVVAEKGGDNRLKIAAVLSLDVFGQPAAYGPLILVRAAGCIDPELCYGLTDARYDHVPFQSDPVGTQGYPIEQGPSAVESVAMAFVSSERLGLRAGQRYFGFSLFADDVDTDDHDPLDPTGFPNDTEEATIASGDAADLHGGMSGWFIDESLSNGSGRAFLDENGDGVPNADEAGIADIQIQLYRDTDGDGLFDITRDEPVCNATDTDASGLFVLPGLPDGDYFAVLRENDPELPSGLALGPEANPLPFSIGGNDVDTLHFAFTGTGGGDTGGADTSGTTDGGNDDAGNTDVGGADTAGTDGGNDGGGNTDAGGADTGGTTDGAGNTDAGGADTAGTGDDGNGDAGNTDAGGADTGGADTGGTTDGVATGGDPADPGPSLDDSVTRAERDFVDVRQDLPEDVDVLANDTDGSGLGLTIIRVGDAPNGATEIIDTDGDGQAIRYSPDMGFIGSDSFVYEIRDGEGVERSGTVTVDVIRFSDINGNGLDDFVECRCTDLTLETGVHGSGVGRPSLALLALLLGAGAVRVRRRSGVGAGRPR